MNLLCLNETDEKVSLNDWLEEIKNDVNVIVQEEDDGDRDNIMLNVEFAAHFLRLCKLLPLWSGISCKVFGSKSVTSSSANVESYFKDVKHTLEDIIPASADVFLQNHLDGINDSIITASQRYAKLININVAEITKVPSPNSTNLGNPITYDGDSDFDASQLFTPCSPDKDDHNSNSNSELEELGAKDSESNNSSFASSQENSPNEKCRANTSKSNASCICCSQGNFPTGAHKCIKCGKNVHIFEGCSYSIGSEEGYGSKRICMSCHSEKQKSTRSQDVKEMNTIEKWKAKKQKGKQSIYLQNNPAFNLMSDTKKTKIGLLKNGTLCQTTKRVLGEAIQFSNTCAFDSIAQALAGAYAYYPCYRKCMITKQSDALMKIAIYLANK